MRISLSSADPRLRLLLRRFPRIMAIAYSLPVWAYLVIKLRSGWLLFGWLLLLAVNIAMFRLGEVIDSGGARPRILLIYGFLFTSLIIVGLTGILRLF